MDDWFPNLDLSPGLILTLAIAELALLGIGFILVWAILKVRDQPAPAMLTVSLGLLTLTCVLAFALTRMEVLGTLAATGLGAIAGSLTNVLQSNNKNQNGSNKDDSGKEL